MKNVQNTLSVMFKIRPGEGAPTLLLLVHSFFMGFSLVFLETASYALFLTRFNIETLPYVYILSAVITTACGLIYGKLEERLPFARLLILTVSILFLSVLLFYIGLTTAADPRLYLPLVVWYHVAFVLITLEFWSLANRLLNVRQGKRLFGLIGVGEILAGIIGGLSVPLLIPLVSTPGLLVFSALGLLACLGILVYITRSFSKRISAPEEAEEEAVGGPADGLLKNRYFRFIIGVSVLSTLGFFLLDYVFYDLLETRYPTEDQIARFLGIFIAVLGFINLFSNAFLHSRLIERYGLSLGLLAVPTVVAAGSIIALLAHLPGALILFFWVMVITKTFDEVARTSIEEPSFRILYQPFPALQRLRAQTLLETTVEPIAGALAGAVLIVLTSYLAFETVGIVYIICAVLAGWLVLAFFLRKEYTTALTRALSKRRLSGKTLTLGDASSIEVLKNGLKSKIPGEVINCLDMLEDIEHESVGTSMIELLDHPSPEVRRHVLEKMGEIRMAEATDPITRHLEKEKDPRVLGTALRTLCAVSEAEAFDLVYAYLEDPDMDLEIKRGAMAGLLSNGGIDGVLSAGSKLNLLLESENPEERQLAAQVLGEVGIASFYRPLLKLLEDPNLRVRAAAITASGELKNPRLLPMLLKHFSVPDLSNVAVSAVTRFGPDILPDLETAFDREDQSREVRVKLVRIMGKIGGPRAIDILRKKIDFSEEDIRSHVLSALVSCKYQAEVAEIDTIHERIQGEVADATWTLSVLVDIGEHQEGDILIRALKSEVEKNRKRIFSLLAMIHPTHSIVQAQLNLAGNSKDRRANALEMLDNILSTDIKNIVFPLLDDIPSTQRHSRLVAHFPQKRMSRHERLKEILARSQQWTSAWTKTCALFVVGKIATREFHDAIVSSLADPDPVVRETATWALGCLNPDDLVHRLQPLKRDRSPRVADFARFVINSVGFSSIPMGKSGYMTKTGRYTADLFVNMLQDDGERRIRRCRAANILSRFDVPAARDALMESLTINDKTVRTAVLDALIKGQFTVEPGDRDDLIKLLGVEFRDAERILESILIFLPDNRSAHLVRALNQELDHNRRRILSLLALLSEDRELVETALERLFYWYIHNGQKQIPTRETGRLRRLLASAKIPKQQGEKLFALFQYRNPVRLQEVWSLSAPHSRENMERHLRQIAFGSSVFALSWSRICALEMIVRLNLTGCVPRIIERLRSGDDVVRATSAWALFKLNAREYGKFAAQLRNDPSFLVSQTAKQLGQGGAAPPARSVRMAHN